MRMNGCYDSCELSTSGQKMTTAATTQRANGRVSPELRDGCSTECVTLKPRSHCAITGDRNGGMGVLMASRNGTMTGDHGSPGLAHPWRYGMCGLLVGVGGVSYRQGESAQSFTFSSQFGPIQPFPQMHL